VQDGLRQAHAALEALGQGVDGLVQHAAQRHAVDHRIDAPAPLGRLQPPHAGHEVQEPPRRHVAVQRRAFRQVADGGLHRQRLTRERHAAHLDLARGRLQITGDHLHGGRLAGAVRPQKAHHLAAADAERQIVHRPQRPEILGQMPDRDPWLHACLVRKIRHSHGMSRRTPCPERAAVTAPA
jgi:hypothetical protein